ncbi:spermiogenesis-related protein stanley-cup isoform X1 [Colletes latitarsis]|uniref:spermiogenesis-related protein stanley-cup isoform X1 n=1 Tax=Colletes latitarsis TaxID=2605962 RepID=UPI004036B473
MEPSNFRTITEHAENENCRTTFRKTLPVLAAVEVGSSNKRNATNEDVAILPGYNVTTTASGAASKTNHFDTDLHGNVNILLGGAMLSGVIMVVALMCYCCHKSIRKNRPQEYPQYWRTEPDVHSLEVFTTEAHTACCERQSATEGNQEEGTYGAPSCPVSPSSGPGPPPTYDSLIFDPRSLPASIEKKSEGPDTPRTIIPSMVSTFLGLTTSPVRSAECNEPVEQETSAIDEGLPSYEAALKLDANGYV